MRYFAFVLLAIAISSCCKNELISTVKFSEEALAVSPYDGIETLKFIDDTSTIITYGSGSRTTTMEDLPECDGGCCNYYAVETTNLSYFESDYWTSNIQVIITNQFDRFNGVQVSPIISFNWVYWGVYEDPTYTNFPSLPVDNMEETATNQNRFLDSLVLRDKTYYDVFTLPGECSSPDRIHPDTMYYTINEGVIGMKFTNDNLWSLTD